MIRTASLVTLVMALVLTVSGGCEKKVEERKEDLPATSGEPNSKGKGKGKVIEAGVQYVPPK
jgi:hypothetical protein